MSTLNQELNAIKTVEDTLTANKVANFAYTQEAYDNNDADGVEEYDFGQEQNIPVADLDILRVNETVLTKGWRSQASAITRMLMNHFLGRLSYNLNKLNDNVSRLLSTLIAKAGNADGFATLDSNGRIPYSQLPESAIEYKGQWDASTNTPTLADGTGTKGDFYIVSVAGTQNLGSGNIQFFVNDRVIYDGSVWSRLSAGDVKSVNNITPVNGNITLGKGDIGLGNVVNTGDEDIPTAGSTKKFTSAGAYNTLTSLAPAFDETVTYNVGNYVTYQGKLYKCTKVHTGAWDIADFSLVTLGEDLEKTAPLNYFLDVEQDQYKKWIDGNEVYRKVTMILADGTVFDNADAIQINQMLIFHNKIYATSPMGLWIIKPTGSTEQVTGFTGSACDALCIYNDKLYVGHSNGISVSTDGVTFENNTSHPQKAVYTLSVFQNKLYAGGAGSSSYSPLFVSTDGANFSPVTVSGTNSILSSIVFNNKLYLGAQSAPIRYTSDGVTFTAINSATITTRAFGIYNNKLYVGQLVSENGIDFTNSGLQATHSNIYGFGVYQGKLYVGVRNSGLYVSSDGATFTLNSSMPTSEVCTSFIEHDLIFYIGGWSNIHYAVLNLDASNKSLTLPIELKALLSTELLSSDFKINYACVQIFTNRLVIYLSSETIASLSPMPYMTAILEYTKS